MPEERSRCATDVLRLPGRTLETSSYNQPDRKHSRDDPLAASKNERQRNTSHEPGDDVQAGSVSAETLETPQRPRADHPPARRKTIRGWSVAGRRLEILTTQHLTIPHVGTNPIERK